MDFLIFTLIGFLAGSIPFSVWLVSTLRNKDIRKYGDSNPGATNAWKAAGWKLGIPAGTLDYLKGVVPVSIAHFLLGISGLALVPVALSPIVGHAFSPFLGFKGGKAIATTFGVWTVITFWWGPIILGISMLLSWALQVTHAWIVVMGLLIFLVFILIFSRDASILLVWAGNTAIVSWKHRHDLKLPIEWRTIPIGWNRH